MRNGIASIPLENASSVKFAFLYHCVKSVQIRSFFWSVFTCIRSEYGDLRTRKNSVFGHFSRSVHFKNKTVVRISRSEVLCKKDLQTPATLLKKRFSHRCFLVNFAKFLRTPFHVEYLVAEGHLLPTSDLFKKRPFLFI